MDESKIAEMNARMRNNVAADFDAKLSECASRALSTLTPVVSEDVAARVADRVIVAAHRQLARREADLVDECADVLASAAAARDNYERACADFQRERHTYARAMVGVVDTCARIRAAKADIEATAREWIKDPSQASVAAGVTPAAAVCASDDEVDDDDELTPTPLYHKHDADAGGKPDGAASTSTSYMDALRPPSTRRRQTRPNVTMSRGPLTPTLAPADYRRIAPTPASMRRYETDFAHLAPTTVFSDTTIAKQLDFDDCDDTTVTAFHGHAAPSGHDAPERAPSAVSTLSAASAGALSEIGYGERPASTLSNASSSSARRVESEIDRELREIDEKLAKLPLHSRGGALQLPPTRGAADPHATFVVEASVSKPSKSSWASPFARAPMRGATPSAVPSPVAQASTVRRCDQNRSSKRRSFIQTQQVDTTYSLDDTFSVDAPSTAVGAHAGTAPPPSHTPLTTDSMHNVTTGAARSESLTSTASTESNVKKRQCQLVKKDKYEQLLKEGTRAQLGLADINEGVRLMNEHFSANGGQLTRTNIMRAVQTRFESDKAAVFVRALVELGALKKDTKPLPEPIPE